MSRSIYVWLNRMTCNLIEFDLFPDCYLWQLFKKRFNFYLYNIYNKRISDITRILK